MTSISDHHADPTIRVGARASAVLVPVACGAAVVNQLIFAAGRAAGVDFVVRTPFADRPELVGWASVLAMSSVPVLAASLLLWATRRSARAWVVLAWLGLLVGVVSMPVFSTATVGTKVALSFMHLVPATAWWAAVRRELATTSRRAR